MNLTYDDQGRAFWDGKRIPRTTEVCALLAPRTWSVEDYYLEKGRIIHLLTEYEDNGELLEESVDSNLAGYLKAYRQFKIDSKFRVIDTELKFYSQKWKYCGRVDKYGELFSYLSVLDIKSGAPHEADQYQAPAYLFGLKDNGFPCWRTWDLYLKTNGTYRLEEVKKPSILFNKFMGGVKAWKAE